MSSGEHFNSSLVKGRHSHEDHQLDRAMSGTPATLRFLGAAETVTGSRYLLEAAGARAAEAAAIDARIASAWAGHPNLHTVERATDFVEKVPSALALIRKEVPECCRHHELKGLGR
jgi:hypothetical protein